PLPCQGSALPLSYAPGVRIRRRSPFEGPFRLRDNRRQASSYRLPPGEASRSWLRKATQIAPERRLTPPAISALRSQAPASERASKAPWHSLEPASPS